MATAGALRGAGAYVDLSLQDRATAALQRHMRALQRYATSVSSIGRRLTTVSLAPALGIGYAVKSFADLEDQLLQLQALARPGATPFASLSDQVKELGRTTSFTARQVAEGATSLARGGFDTSEISAALADTLNLSRATGTELGQAADIMINVMRSFGLGATEASRASDVLVATASGSAQTLEDLFESLKLLGPFAVETGTSLEEMAASLGLLANNGIKGSLAGNAVVRAYRNLANPAFGRQIEEITGKAVVDGAGNVRPLVDVLEELNVALTGAGSARRLSVFEDIFGRGQLAATVLAKAGDSFRSFTADLRTAGGTAAKVAKDMDSGAGGAIRRMLSAWEGLVNTIGEALAGPLADLLEWATLVIERLGGWLAKNEGIVIQIAAITAAAITAGPALIAIGAAFGAIVSAGSLLISSVSAVVGLLTSVGSVAISAATSLAALGPAGVAAGVALSAGLGTGAGAAIEAVKGGISDVSDSFAALRQSVIEDMDALANAVQNGRLGDAFSLLALRVRAEFERLMDDMETRHQMMVARMIDTAAAMDPRRVVRNTGTSSARWIAWAFGGEEASRRIGDAAEKVWGPSAAEAASRYVGAARNRFDAAADSLADRLRALPTAADDYLLNGGGVDDRSIFDAVLKPNAAPRLPDARADFLLNGGGLDEQANGGGVDIDWLLNGGAVDDMVNQMERLRPFTEEVVGAFGATQARQLGAIGPGRPQDELKRQTGILEGLLMTDKQALELLQKIARSRGIMFE